MTSGVISPLAVTNYTLTSALGRGIDATARALEGKQSGLRRNRFPGAESLDTWVGEVSGLEDITLPHSLSAYDCRNNRLAFMGLNQDGFADRVTETLAKYGRHRVGLFIGTSTSGIRETEKAYRAMTENPEQRLPSGYNYLTTHNNYSAAAFIRDYLDVQGVGAVISTACSSSAKVFASAHRAITAGLCDAALVGGVDSLCLTTLYGFNALQLVSQNPCRPADANRDGISIGEAAGFALLEKSDCMGSGTPVLLGYGESADAYHMSTPHPEGQGAVKAMAAALVAAALEPKDIDYINLHGTGTQANDLSESIAVAQLFGKNTPCSSTKGWTGHMLGAAGIAEAVISLLCLRQRWVPGTLNINTVDPAIPCHILHDNRAMPVNNVLTNSFGFGGSNCSLIFGNGAAGVSASSSRPATGGNNH